MRDAAFAQLGDTNLADGVVAGHLADVRRDRNRKRTEPRRNRAAGQGQRSRCRASCSRAAPPAARCCSDPKARRSRTASGRPTSTASSPPSATSGAGESARPSLYGHGLFGDAGEVGSGPQRSLSQAHDIVQCATDEIGMSETDVPSAVAALQNLSAFPKIPDRLQQGLLDELYLGRAMISPSGFTTNAAFHQDGTLASAVGARTPATSTTTATARAGSWAAR